MMEEDDISFDDLKSLFDIIQEKVEGQLPMLKAKVQQLIAEKSQDETEIEEHLDKLLNLARLGVAEQPFIDLIRYYKSVNGAAADYYWDKYDLEEEEE